MLFVYTKALIYRESKTFQNPIPSQKQVVRLREHRKFNWPPPRSMPDHFLSPPSDSPTCNASPLFPVMANEGSLKFISFFGKTQILLRTSPSGCFGIIITETN